MSKLKYPSIASSLIIFLILIVFTLILGAPFAILPEYVSWFDKNIANVFAYVLSMLATIYVVYKRIKKTSDVESVFNFSIGRLDKYLFIVPLTLVMMLWVDFFASLIPMPDWVADIFKEAFNLSIPNIIMIAIMAPLLEEVLVRGLVLRGYLLNYSPIKAIIASAIFFGLIHMNPWQFIGGFISGVFLGYLYYKTKSLIPSILVHFLNNSLSVVFSFFYVEADASFVDMLGSELYYVILIISIALGYVLYRKLDKILNVENIM
jgi:membrane protease YdiL (CAAX protease family)